MISTEQISSLQGLFLPWARLGLHDVTTAPPHDGSSSNDERRKVTYSHRTVVIACACDILRRQHRASAHTPYSKRTTRLSNLKNHKNERDKAGGGPCTEFFNKCCF